MDIIKVSFMLAVAIRMVSLVKSISNEKKLKKAQAVEYGKINSRILTMAHILFYLSCLMESIVLGKEPGSITFMGIGLFIFSMIILWIVIISLGEVWTVKLIIAPQHKVNESFIFRYFRHPNYFLNIIPELISIALICQAWFTLLIGLPVYLIPLAIRIRQEEKIMKKHFTNY